MRLSELVTVGTERAPSLGWTRIGDPATAGDPEIRSVVFDSRVAGPGDLFVCVPGGSADGHAHAAAAVAAGAVAVVAERPPEPAVPPHVPVVGVTTARPAMAHLACIVEGDPSAQLFAVGVTGTNGKTTTAHLVASVCDHVGLPCGLVGTLTGARTTPEAPHLQRALGDMVAAGRTAVAMEVSSHALVQHRVTGTRFAVGVFTNLSPDHLDYHGDMETYFAAKASLFTPELVAAAVVNADDPWGRRLLEEISVPATAVHAGDASDLQMRIDGSTFRWRDQPIRLALPGHFNVMNALVAAEAVRHAGVSDAAIAAGLSAAGGVAGRFEIVTASGDGPVVIVDYAHTPDGIEQVLASIRTVTPGATVCIVFGCGGDRDRDKRPLMGRAAAAADHVIVTSDNPRSEDPDAIIGEILPGLVSHPRVEVEPDRRAAIEAAVAAHGPGDVVLVAGKGHETTQTIGDTVAPFDDREVAREALGRSARRDGGGAAR